MNKIYFHYSAMNAGKSTMLLQAAYNYIERGMNVILFKPEFDIRDTEEPKIVSRIGLSMDCVLLPTTNEANLSNDQYRLNKSLIDNLTPDIKAVFIDEVQFFSKSALLTILKMIHIGSPDAVVMTYGLRNSFNGKSFPSSVWLLQNAEKLVEVKTICWCGNKATHNLMIGEDGTPIKDPNLSAIELGGNEKYISLCRTHWDLGKYKEDQFKGKIPSVKDLY